MNNQISLDLENSSLSQLPVMVNFNDVRNLVRFLKRKPEGFSIIEINDIFLRRLLDSSKLMAYEEWGLINNENNSIYLSGLGLELAKCSDLEARNFQKILHKIEPYLSAIEWISQQNKNIFVYLEILDFWKTKYPTLLINKDNVISENIVMSFFNLCHYSELGVATIGRKSHLTRLNVDTAEIIKFLSRSIDKTAENPSKINNNGISNGNGSFKTQFLDRRKISNKQKKIKFFLSANENSELLSSIEELFDISEVEFEVVIRQQNETYGLWQNHQKMKSCSAAIIIADDRNQVLCSGNHRINEQLLSEIVATYTYFDSKVIFLWNGKFCPQLPVEGIKMMCLKAKKLDWDNGMKIGRIIKDFKQQTL